MMDNAIVKSKIVGKNEYPQHGSTNDFESSKDDCLSKVLAEDPSSIKKLQIRDFYTQKLLLQQISVLKKTIPKQIMTLEEKYLRHCLEIIHMSTIRENSCSLSTKAHFFPDRFSSRVVGGEDLLLFSSGNENVVINSSVNPIVGSITGSTSMINLMNSPLLRQLAASENNNISYENPNVTEVSESLCVGDQNFQCDPVHKRLVSFSSTNSVLSSPSTSISTSSSSSSTTASSSAYSHGMLHCSWNNGFPRYVFSIEDQREVYTTNLLKTDSDYVYMFYSRSGKRENETNDYESDLVGKMRVSTSFTLCPLGTEIMETQFVLCATGHHIEGVMPLPTSNQTVKKSIGLSKKVANILKGNHSYRQWSSSKFDGSVGQQDMFLQSNEEEIPLPANFELAAIVVKDHTPKKVEVGGWGLKFLKEGGQKQKTCDHHSISMDVVVPAGFHGGPRTKKGGPSGLVERWRSGGRCDCGGWDMGCPLTVLNSGPNSKDVLYQDGVFGKSNAFELFAQGCKQSLAADQQSRDSFWGKVLVHFDGLMGALSERTRDQLNSKWKKLNTKLSNFNALYIQTVKIHLFFF